MIGGSVYYYFYHYLPRQTVKSFLQLNKDQIKRDTIRKGDEKEEEEEFETVGYENNEKESRIVVDNSDNVDNDKKSINKELKWKKGSKVDSVKVERIASEGKERTGFRNPFEDFRQDTKNLLRFVRVSSIIDADKSTSRNKDEVKVTVDKLKSNLPFILTGIIGDEEKKLAVIQDSGGSKILKNGDYIGKFRVLSIRKENIVLFLNGIIFDLGLRSDKSEG